MGKLTPKSKARKGDWVVVKQRTSFHYADMREFKGFRFRLMAVVRASREGAATHVSHDPSESKARDWNALRTHKVEQVWTVRPHHRDPRLKGLLGCDFESSGEARKAILEAVGQEAA